MLLKDSQTKRNGRPTGLIHSSHQDDKVRKVEVKMGKNEEPAKFTSGQFQNSFYPFQKDSRGKCAGHIPCCQNYTCLKCCLVTPSLQQTNCKRGKNTHACMHTHTHPQKDRLLSCRYNTLCKLCNYDSQLVIFKASF